LADEERAQNVIDRAHDTDTPGGEEESRQDRAR
jgi:hypothetical protein